MDTSRLFVILTTNRIDLLDEALRDRFITVEFPPPPKEILVKVAEEKLRSYGINDEEIIEKTKQEILNGAKTFRDVNKIVTQKYIEWIVKKYSF